MISMSRQLTPALAGVFLVGLGLGLFAASLAPLPEPVVESASYAAVSGNGVPWEPLSNPETELARVSAIVERKGVPPEERLRELVARADDPNEPPLARGLAAFAAGLHLLEAKRLDEAAARLLSPEIAVTDIRAYALHIVGRELQETDPHRAQEALTRLLNDDPDFLFVDESRLRLGRLLAEAGLEGEAAHELRQVVEVGTGDLQGEARLELAEALTRLGEKTEAARLLEKLYYETPTHPLSADAGKRLASLRRWRPARTTEESYRLAFERAERQNGSGRYRDAYDAYTRLLQQFPKQVDRDLVHLRRGVCQYRRRQSSSAEKTLALVKRAELRPEALYYQAEAALRLRKPKVYQERLEEVFRIDPKGPWAEEGLWSLARYQLLEDDVEKALTYFARLAAEFPGGRYDVSARWGLLWDHYRSGRYAEAAAGLEVLAREYPGSDELPRLLYWAARAHEGSGRPDRGVTLYRQVVFGYRNTYYGWKAEERLRRLGGEEARDETVESVRRSVDLSEALRVLRTDRLRRIGQLLAVGLYAEAEAESERAVEGASDDSSFLAILAWIQHRAERYGAAMASMRRAFPFQVSVTGDLLPRQVWEILYPLRYWDLVERHSREQDIDPYLVVGLIRQESTFEPRARSQAGALGLMQIMPATGRRLAREHRRRYRTGDLYNPEISIQYGTRYFRQLLDRFGGRLDYALAGYNAGAHRVQAWTGMDLTLDSEEFIEEIPFTETRNYVKLVLRNEALYRRLYGGPTAPAE